MEMLSPVSLGTVTPSFEDVQPLPPTGVADPFWVMPVILTVRLLGFWTWTIRSAELPGTSVEVGEPLATAWTVTVVAVPSVAEPWPFPDEVKKANAAPPASPRSTTSTNATTKRERRITNRSQFRRSRG
jgi:hypothetical protein